MDPGGEEKRRAKESFSGEEPTEGSHEQQSELFDLAQFPGAVKPLLARTV